MTQIPNKVISSMPFEELNSYGAWHKVSSEQYYLVAKNPSEQLRLDVQKLFPICREKKACLGTRLHRWRPKAAFFDMDSTLVREETLDEIAHAYGVLDKVKNITELAMAGKMDFKESLTQRLATLKGCPLSTVKKVIQSITYNQNVKLTIRNLQQSQIPCYLVSGGFTEVAAPVAKELGIRQWYANEFDLDDFGNLTGLLHNTTIVDELEKKNWIEAQCGNLGIQPHDALAVGDGANDRAMMQCIGLSVGYKPKDVLFPYLNAVNFSGDHDFLVQLVGG